MKATQWPKDWKMNAKMRDYATSHGISYLKLDDFWGEFQDWAEANEAKYKNWNAAFRMRVRKAKEWNLFQGPAKPIPRQKVPGQDKLMTAFQALSMGRSLDNVRDMLGLTDYEVECVKMAFKVKGLKRVDRLTVGLLKDMPEDGREEKIAVLREQACMLRGA